MVRLLPQAVFETDAEGRVTFVNQALLDLFGIEAQIADSGLRLTSLAAPEDRGRMMDDFFRMLKTDRLEGEPPVEYQAARRDGHRFPVLVSTRPIVRGEGRLHVAPAALCKEDEHAQDGESPPNHNPALGIVAGHAVRKVLPVGVLPDGEGRQIGIAQNKKQYRDREKRRRARTGTHERATPSRPVRDFLPALQEPTKVTVLPI
jgi:PAS domain S-box-containing protein